MRVNTHNIIIRFIIFSFQKIQHKQRNVLLKEGNPYSIDEQRQNLSFLEECGRAEASSGNREQNYLNIIAENEIMNGRVSINTYFDNQVVFSGRKVRNNLMAALKAYRPRLIVRQVDVIDLEQPYVKDKKTIGKRSRNKNKTVHMNKNIQPKPTSSKKRASVELESLRKGIHSVKKVSASSSPPKCEKHFELNEIQKKMKPVYKGKGLGKRSKSTIIKSNRSPEKPPARVRTASKKAEKAEKGQANNKTEVKKEKKQNPGAVNQQSSNKPKRKASQVGVAKAANNQDSSLLGSQMSLLLNKKKGDKISSNKSSRPDSKTQRTSAKQSKPTSARENRHSKRLFDGEDPNERSDQKRQFKNIDLSGLEAKHKNDQPVLKILSDLEIALNVIGNRTKKDLETIAESVKALAGKIKKQDSKQEDEESDAYLRGNLLRTKQEFKKIEEQEQKRKSLTKNKGAENFDIPKLKPSPAASNAHNNILWGEDVEQVIYDEKQQEAEEEEEESSERDEMVESGQKGQFVQQWIVEDERSEHSKLQVCQVIRQPSPFTVYKDVDPSNSSEQDSEQSQKDTFKCDIQSLKKFKKDFDLMEMRRKSKAGERGCNIMEIKRHN